MKKTLFLLTLTIVCTAVCAQKNLRIDRYEAWTPTYISDPKGSPNGIQTGQSWQQWCENSIKQGNLGEDTKRAWVVYSDRSHNSTYLTPSYDNKSNITLSFGQRLFVAKIENGFALVFTDEKDQDKYPKINKSAQFLGWVPIENLLLWQTCPKSRHEIYQKALVVYDPESDEEADPNYLLNPAVNGEKSNIKATDLDILFVMKTRIVNGKTYYLLSNQMNIFRNVRSDLNGWLPSELITPWDQRLVLEPTHRPGWVYEYEQRNLKPVTFLKYEQAEKFYQDGTMDSAFSTDNLSRTRMKPEIMRYPIIGSTQNEHIFQVAAMSAKEGDGYQNNRAEIMREMNQLTKQQQNINVIFVIDATSSMKEFFPAISKALKDVMSRQFFTNPETKSLIRVGCVLYRDYADQKRTEGIEYRPLTSNLESISSFLTQVNPRSIDNDDWEAMFDGIETALDHRKMGYEPDQSNFLVLIGDAGNHPKDKNKRIWQEVSIDLAEQMSKNKINFIAYQINNKGTRAYDDFRNQVSLMQNKLTAHYSNDINIPMKYVRIRPGVLKLVRETGSTDIPIYNMYTYQEVGKSESALDMTNEIVNKIEDFYQQVTERIVQLRRVAEGGYKLNNQVEVGHISEMLRFAGWPQARIQRTIRLMQRGGVAKFITYAPEKVQSIPYNIYNYVLFFSRDELTKLVQALDRINSTDPNQARLCQEAFIALGKSMLGEFTEAQIGKMDIDELVSQMYGIPIRIETRENVQIDNIVNLPKDQVNRIINDFKKGLSTLKDILANDGQGGRFEKNGIEYYWVELQHMPGFFSTAEIY